MAHRVRRGHRGLPVFLAGKPTIRADPVRRSSRRTPPAAGTTTSARRSTSTSGAAISYPFVLASSFAAPGQLDVHRLRRLGPRGRGDGRRPRRQRVGRSSCRSRSAVVGLRLPRRPVDPLPNLSTLFPAPLTDDPPANSQYYFGDGAAVIDILELQPRPDARRPARRRHRRRDGVLRLVVDRLGRPDAVSPSAATTACPAVGWLKRVSHRYRTPANALTAIVVVGWLLIGRCVLSSVGGDGRHHRHRRQHVLLYGAYGVCIDLGAATQAWRKERVWSLGRWRKPIAVGGGAWII